MDARPNKRPKAYPKVNQPMIDAILKDISLGSPKKHAAHANGISISHFHNLIAQGVVDIEWGISDSLPAKMVVSLAKIEQIEIQGCRKIIRQMEDGHKGAQWTLEHAYWRYFGKDANAKELADEIERIREEIKGAKNDEANISNTEENSEE